MYPAGQIQRKVYIPIEKYPNYNFLGLIIGPRGTSHRKLEAETKTTILIRGKGGSKENRGTVDTKNPDEPLHVIIQGNNEIDVQRAVERIEQLCVPIADELNTLKQSQMRELAVLNGTQKSVTICSICGGQGHTQYECPNRESLFLGWCE